MKTTKSIVPSPATTQVEAAEAHETRSAGILSIKSANEWIDESMKNPDPKMFFHNLIVQYENTVLFASSNVGKSILATQVCEDIAKTEKVLYLDLELSAKQFQMRYTDPATGKVHRFPSNFSRAEINPERMIDGDLSQATLDSIEEAAQSGIKFFVIDNITFICNDIERGKKAGDFMKKLIRLKKKYDLTSIVIAHTPKRRGWKPITQNDLAGSAKLINFFDAGIALARSANGANFRYLKQVKVRTGEFFYDSDNVLILEVNKDNGFLKFDIVGTGLEDEHLNKIEEAASIDDELITILKMHKSGMSIREIAEATDYGKSTIQRRLAEASKNNVTIPEEESVPDVPCGTVGHVGQSEPMNDNV